MTTRYSNKSRYCVELAGWTTDSRTGDVEFEQVAEAGPYRTRLGAFFAMKRRHGMSTTEIDPRETEGLPDPRKFPAIIVSATIARFTDAEGTQEGWDYDARLNMVEHWSNY